MKFVLLTTGILLLSGCGFQDFADFLNRNPEVVEITADTAGTVWPPLKWIILAAASVTTAVGIKKGKS